MNFSFNFKNILNITISQNQNALRTPEFSVFLRSLFKDVDDFKSDMESEISLKFCADLLKVLYVSNKKLARQLLEQNYADNPLQLRNRILSCVPSFQVANVRMKGMVNILHYFSAAEKSPGYKVVRSDVKQTSIASLMNDVRFGILCSSNQKVDFKDTGADFISKCFKYLTEIYLTSEFKMFNCTENYMQQNFKVLETAVVPVLQDDTSNVSIDKKCENNACEIADKTEIILSNSRCVEAVRSDSGNSSLPDSYEETNVKIALHNHHYNDDARKSMMIMTTDSDSDSDDNVRLRNTSDGWEYKRMNSNNYDDVFGNDDEFIKAFSDCISDEIPAVSFLPDQEPFQFMESSFCYQGFENPCFEDDSNIGESSYIKMVNDNWKVTMEGVPEEPRESTKVSFVSTPNLVTVRHFDREDDDYTYRTSVINQMLFRCRILDFESIMAPFMTLDHRKHIRRRNNSSIC